MTENPLTKPRCPTCGSVAYCFEVPEGAYKLFLLIDRDGTAELRVDRILAAPDCKITVGLVNDLEAEDG